MGPEAHVITSTYVVPLYEMKWGEMNVTCECSLERHVWVHGVQWRDEA